MGNLGVLTSAIAAAATAAPSPATASAVFAAAAGGNADPGTGSAVGLWNIVITLGSALEYFGGLPPRLGASSR